MHRWLLNLTGDELSGRFFAPYEAGGGANGSAAPSDSGASPAAPSSSESAPAAPSSASEPSTSPPDGGAAPSSESPKGDSNFDFMDFDDDDQGVVVEPPAAPEGGGAPAAAPSSAQPQPQAPQPQAPGGQAPQGAASHDAGASPIPTDPGELVESIRQNAPALIDAMAPNYQLSKEEAEALETDVVGTLPRLFAKVHLNATVSALHNMKQLIPQMIRDAIKADRTRSSNLDAFYSAFPQLNRNDKTHTEVVARLGAAYRRANPTASREQAIKDIGLLALQHLGLPFQAPSGPNGRTVSQRPFVPAVGGSPASPTPAPVLDKFAGLEFEFDD